MYNETKLAVKKAFEIGKVIFGLGPEKYAKLVKAVSKVRFPSDKELKKYMIEGLCLEDAKGLELKKRYEQAAIDAGFTKKQGFTMLKYAAILKEIEHE
jgi:hypothetical protein